MTFTSLGIIAPIIKAIELMDYKNPTPIQQQSIPEILKGKDIMGCAQTGTGKTAAFSIPILQALSQSKANSPHPKALILVPTRELASQIGQNIEALSSQLKIKHTVIFGGVSQNTQVQKLRSGVDIIIATPGRLVDLMNQKLLSLSNIEFFVLDEADNMLDMGFIRDIKMIIKTLPKKKQTLMFSATMPPSIKNLAKEFLQNPSYVSVTPVSSAVETVEQSIMFVNKKEKALALADVLKNSNKNLTQTLVFTRTKHGADRLSKVLKKTGIDSVCIHGNKSQNARENALKSFVNGNIKVLIATDIAARGIDIKELPQVINYDLPEHSETYVHRIGRTGRAGQKGQAISFCSEEEVPLLHKIQKLIGIKVPIIKPTF